MSLHSLILNNLSSFVELIRHFQLLFSDFVSNWSQFNQSYMFKIVLPTGEDIYTYIDHNSNDNKVILHPIILKFESSVSSDPFHQNIKVLVLDFDERSKTFMIEVNNHEINGVNIFALSRENFDEIEINIFKLSHPERQKFNHFLKQHEHKHHPENHLEDRLKDKIIEREAKDIIRSLPDLKHFLMADPSVAFNIIKKDPYIQPIYPSTDGDIHEFDGKMFLSIRCRNHTMNASITYYGILNAILEDKLYIIIVADDKYGILHTQNFCTVNFRDQQVILIDINHRITGTAGYYPNELFEHHYKIKSELNDLVNKAEHHEHEDHHKEFKHSHHDHELLQRVLAQLEHSKTGTDLIISELNNILHDTTREEKKEILEELFHHHHNHNTKSTSSQY